MLKKIRHSKKGIIAMMLICVAAIVTMTSSRDNGDGNLPAAEDPNDINQHPPVAENVFAQMKSNGAGANVLMEIKFKAEDRLRTTPTLQMIGGDGTSVTTLRDDGREGDTKAGDFVFTAFVSEDIDEFVTTMEGLNKELEEGRNNLVVFDNRAGSNVTRQTPFFNRTDFLAGKKIEISRQIFSLVSKNPDQAVKPVGVIVPRGGYCNGDSKLGTGFQFAPVSPTSINRGYGPPPPPAPICYTIKKQHSLFITDLAVVEDPARTFNPCTGAGNPNGAWTFKTLMDGIANVGFTGITTQTLTFYWIDTWIQDITVNGELVRNRAQKTIDMIVGPWIDRASGGAIPANTVTIWNWKDYWFSLSEEKLMAYSPFKLTAIVNRGDLRGNGGYTGGGGTGKISQGETRFIFSAINILKGNDCGKPIGDKCFEGFNVIFEYGNINFDCNFAVQWMNLSKPGLVLGSATYNSMLEAITKTVTAPGAAPNKPNRSAINQVRTNEIALTNVVDLPDDRSPRWQFREYKPVNFPIDLLTPVPLNNEPAGKFNGADGGAPGDVAVLADWVNNNFGPFGLPVPLTHLGNDFKAGKSNYPSASPFSAPGFWNGDAASPIPNPNVRQQFSLNTCSGCHSDETNTIFTHANTVGLGVPMRYVGIMDYVTDGVDTKTQISPFLTGRTYNFAPNNFADDFVNAPEDLSDNSLTGLYYVLDPSGTGQLRGFNDLERRAQDLSNFLLANRCCKVRFSHLIKFSATAFFRPLNSSH